MAAEHGMVEQVKALITPIIIDAQLELFDVEYTQEGQVHYLRIFIDKPGGVTINDCQKISRECEVVLDIEEVIHTQYILEVSSPGLDRPLKKPEDYERCCHRLVKIRTRHAVHGQKEFLGRLTKLTNASATNTCVVTLQIDGDDIDIPYDMIASARLEVEF